MKSDIQEILARLLLDNRRLEKELRIDELTGLGNSRALREHLSQNKQSSLGVLFVDVDKFKDVNEFHGHLAASGVLRDLGKMIGAIAHARGFEAFRYAGDEFVVIANLTSEELLSFGKELCRLVEARLFRVDGHQGKKVIRLTVSVGCQVKLQGVGSEKLLSDADRALFEAKRKSRNTAVLYSG